MNKRTRNFMLGAIGILVAGLCTGLIAYYGARPAGLQARSGEPADLVFVPADATVVAFADVRSVMSSDLRQRLRQVMPDDGRGRDTLREETGIDVETDVDSVVAAFLPGAGSDRAPLAVIRGRFDATRLEALAVSKGGAVEDYRGKRMVRSLGSQQHAGPHGPGALAFVETGLVMVGDEGAVRHGLDQLAAKQNVTSNSEMMQLIQGVDTTSSAWVVGKADVLQNAARLPDGVAMQIPELEWFRASSHVNGGVSGTVTAEARDEQAAKNLRDVLQGFVALARMQSSSKPQFQSLVDAFQFGGSGKTVSVSFALSSDLIDQLVASRTANAAP
jgi:hypothetical protein